MPDREQLREQIIAATGDLLRSGGGAAVTTRAVAAAAGVQAPVIYRLFGDKDGLVRAVAEHAYASFVTAKEGEPPSIDPLDDLRRGWDAAVAFWLEHPELRSMIGADAHQQRSLHDAGLAVLRARVARVAAAGRLRVDPDLAVDLVRATAEGAVSHALAEPRTRHDPAFLVAMREAMVAAVTTEERPRDGDGVPTAAAALRARLPELSALSEAEATLLDEWLRRIGRPGPA